MAKCTKKRKKYQRNDSPTRAKGSALLYIETVCAYWT